MQKILESLEKYILLTTVFLLPVVFLPIFPNAITSGKILILVIGIGLVLLIKAIRTLISGTFEFSLGNFDVPLLILALAYIVSSIVVTPSKMEAFFLPGTATIILGSTLLYFLLNMLKNKDSLKLTLVLSGLTLSLYSLIATSGVFKSIPQLPATIQNGTFNISGSSLVAVILLATLLPIAVSLFIKQKEVVKKAFLGISTLVIIFGLGLSFYQSLPTKTNPLVLPDLNSSWQISIEALKISPLWGMGPGNYLTAFNRFKPLEFNNLSSWSVKFTTGHDIYLTTITETGLVGLAALILILLVCFRVIRKGFESHKDEVGDLIAENGSAFSLGILLILIAILPPSLVIYSLLFMVIALNTTTRNVALNLKAQSSESTKFSLLPAFLVTLPIFAVVIALGFFSYKGFLAEYRFNQALNALMQNDGKKTYDDLVQAISTNPYVDRYHTSLSQVSYALANSIAQNKNLTDNDKTTITQLITQSINDAKAAVSLNSTRSDDWQVLAQTYQSIMPFAQGADQFAIQSYSQAVALEPTNPNLRIGLGGVYYALGRYDEAISVFQLAISAKPDLANAHYNLAAAEREKGNIQDAIDQMTIVLSLVPKDSQDYNVAKTEMDALEAKKPAAKTTTQPTDTTLTTPQKTTPVIKPPLELPKDATPPATQP